MIPSGRTGRRYRVADVVAQSGLSRATVDRVLHSRSGVRAESVAQVERAIDELDRQQALVHLSHAPRILDFVIQAPDRFIAAFRTAIELELETFHPALLRARFHIQERSDIPAVVGVLGEIRARGSAGVVLKAPDHPLVAEAVARLQVAGIPTMTFATDLTDAPRAAYVGVDNRAAGATAAYLTTQVDTDVQAVLVTVSNSSFLGESERLQGFTDALARIKPDCKIVEVADTDGLDESVLISARRALIEHPDITAVYSSSGGNRGAVAALHELGRRARVFVAHDLDEENVALLRTGEVTFILHHDLRSDVRRACWCLLQAGGVLPGHPMSIATQVQVVTPFNEPARLGLGR